MAGHKQAGAAMYNPSANQRLRQSLRSLVNCQPECTHPRIARVLGNYRTRVAWKRQETLNGLESDARLRL